MYSLCSKLFTNYTLTIHWGVQNPTQNGAQTLHKTLHTKLYILFFEHESCEGSKCAVSCGDASRFTAKIFHTQGGFSVLTLLAFGDEKYYICTEIWEEPRLPPFFVTFPLKSGVLEAHPGKICLPLVFLCLPLIWIWGRQSKTARREGKIGRRKVFR